MKPMDENILLFEKIFIDEKGEKFIVRVYKPIEHKTDINKLFSNINIEEITNYINNTIDKYFSIIKKFKNDRPQNNNKR